MLSHRRCGARRAVLRYRTLRRCTGLGSNSRGCLRSTCDRAARAVSLPTEHRADRHMLIGIYSELASSLRAAHGDQATLQVTSTGEPFATGLLVILSQHHCHPSTRGRMPASRRISVWHIAMSSRNPLEDRVIAHTMTSIETEMLRRGHSALLSMTRGSLRVTLRVDCISPHEVRNLHNKSGLAQPRDPSRIRDPIPAFPITPLTPG